MTEMVEFFKLSYYSYRGGKKLHQICSATCIYGTVFELKNILASIVFRSKSKWYKAQKVQKYALNSQLQAHQILKNDDEVEN